MILLLILLLLILALVGSFTVSNLLWILVAVLLIAAVLSWRGSSIL